MTGATGTGPDGAVTVLHVFDMDGTLLRGTSASIEIARAVGRLPALLEMERSFGAGTLSTYDFAVAAYEVFQGLTPTMVAEIFERSPWLTGIEEVMADIRDRDERSLVITMSPDFFADLLRAKGVDEVRASRFPALPLRELPDRADILNPADKVVIVEEVLARHGLAREDCVAYGDSMSDLPLFGHLRHTVAVNATAALRDLAAVHCDADDLRVAYRAARRRLDATPPRSPTSPEHP